jgi:hypothetical protein
MCVLWIFGVPNLKWRRDSVNNADWRFRFPYQVLSKYLELVSEPEAKLSFASECGCHSVAIDVSENGVIHLLSVLRAWFKLIRALPICRPWWS